MTLIDRLGGNLPRGRVTVELDDIQATVLRYRPEPYYGTHVMLHVDDARAGREFLRRLTPHVDSAAEWWQAGERLDRGRHHLLRAGGAGRAGGLAAELPGSVPGRDGRARRRAPRPRRRTTRSTGSQPFGSGQIHIGVSVFSDSEETWRRTMETARQQYEGLSGVTVLTTQDFGAQPGDLNPLGYKDSIGQPAIEGSGVEPLPGQGPADQGRRVHPRLPRRGRRAAAGAAAGRAGTQRHVRRAAQVPVAGRDVQPLPAASTPRPRRSGSCSRRSWWGAGAAARR